MNEEKVLKATRASKQKLLGKVSEIITRTSDEQIRQDIHDFYDFINRFPTCKNMQAVKLDKKIEFLISKYLDSRMKGANILSRQDNEAELRNKIYDEGNRKIFEKFSSVLEHQLAERNDLFTQVEYTKKELKELDEFQRNSYLSKNNEKSHLEEKWNAEGAILDFTVKNYKLFYERQYLQEQKKVIIEKGKTDKLNRESYISQLEGLDRQIASISANESILFKEIANNRNICQILDDVDLEKFIVDNQYASGKLEDFYKKYAKESKTLAQARTEKTEVIDVIQEDYDATRAKAMPKNDNVTKSKYAALFEQSDTKELDEQMNKAKEYGWDEEETSEKKEVKK